MTQATYSQLDRVLSSLGFSVRVVTIQNKLRVYEHDQSGARISLAFHDDDETVSPHHMAAVQGTLRVFGIADPVHFAARLQKAG